MNTFPTELPTLADAGIAAMAEGKPRAVDAIARALKRQEAAQLAKLEEIWGCPDQSRF